MYRLNMIDITDIISSDGYLTIAKSLNILYIKTDYFFNGYNKYHWRNEIHEIIELPNVCFIGHSDYSITPNIADKFCLSFVVNKQNSNPSCYNLPLGITNLCNDSSKHLIYGNTDIMYEVISTRISKNILCYMNFNINTHNERIKIFEMFKSQSYVYIGNIDDTLLGRKNFLIDIKKSKFVLCPRGNGIDTHRLWETLYMGSFPIVIYDENLHNNFRDLPILFIREWSEITEDFLHLKYLEMCQLEYNYDKLKLSYWKKYIKTIYEEKMFN